MRKRTAPNVTTEILEATPLVMTTDQAASLVGAHPRTVVRMVKDGRLKAKVVGGRYYVTKQSVLDLLGMSEF